MSRGRMGLLTGLVVVLVLVGNWLAGGSGDDPSPPAVTSPRIVALGDSYISGEGAGSFEVGTNSVGSNECRRAATSYPYLIRDALHATLVSVACSGAKVKDVLAPQKPVPRDGQYPESPAGIAGGEKQLEAVAGNHPDTVLLSIGGNDIRFSQIVQSCIAPGSCLGHTEEYFQRVADVEPKLRTVYRAVLAAFPDAEVYVVTYPMPVAAEECRVAHLSHDEFEFVHEFVHYFDQTIAVAADVVGAHVVNIEETFDGHQICDAVPPEERAMNSLVVSRPHYRVGDVGGWLKKFSSNFHNSYHPTPYGHQLIGGAVLQAMVDTAAESSKDPRQAPIPDGPPSAPPWVPIEYGPPEGPYAFPKGTDCDGEQLVENSHVPPVPANVDSVSLTVPTIAGARVCFRAYKERWDTMTAGVDGVVRVAIQFGNRHGVSSTHEVVYQVEPGTWVKAVIERR